MEFSVFSGNRLYIVAVATLMVALLVASLMLELNAEARVANIKELATAQQRKPTWRSTSGRSSTPRQGSAAIC